MAGEELGQPAGLAELLALRGGAGLRRVLFGLEVGRTCAISGANPRAADCWSARSSPRRPAAASRYGASTRGMVMYQAAMKPDTTKARMKRYRRPVPAN
ncbi:hypothetical protein ACFWN5_23890 [Streptomyces sp. NPDC058430]|uniref:hypothetical protein n=1 Tax=Streptomyces sp. NPDC058430 TaxID=3346495 RepID=UPI0036488212